MTQVNKHWTIKSVAYLVLGIIAIQVICLLLFRSLNLDTANGTASIGLIISSYAVTLVSFLVPLYLFAIRGKSVFPANFGFKQTSLGQILKTVLSGYGILLIVSAILFIIDFVFSGNGIPGFERQSFNYFDTQSKTIALSIIAILIAPVVEEFVFRGFILRTLLTKLPSLLAGILSALIFAVMHFQPSSTLGLFTLGLIINYLYIKNDHSLIPVIIFHSINNLIAVIVLQTIG